MKDTVIVSHEHDMNTIWTWNARDVNTTWWPTVWPGAVPVTVGDTEHDQEEDEREEDGAGDEVDHGGGDGDGDAAQAPRHRSALVHLLVYSGVCVSVHQGGIFCN